MLELQVRAIVTVLQARDALLARTGDERGMTTETVIITAVLATLALAVGVIITTKVTGKANSIPMDGSTPAGG
jgi:hypothetical protein